MILRFAKQWIAGQQVERAGEPIDHAVGRRHVVACDVQPDIAYVAFSKSGKPVLGHYWCGGCSDRARRPSALILSGSQATTSPRSTAAKPRSTSRRTYPSQREGKESCPMRT